jgi:putative YhdH/YhfP family quinone oxidoreductase
MDEHYRAYRVHVESEAVRAGVERVAVSELPEHDVTIEVAYTSLNYKDALSARGNRGVTRSYPHTPGIDAAGRVVASRDPAFAPGDEVIVTSYDLGMNTPGGFGERIRVPGAWVVPLPVGLGLRTAMALGTAGLTAGLAVDALVGRGLEPGHGPVLVTGASGGVGSLAVALLAHLGFEVVASSGKAAAHELLTELGASRVVDRSTLSDRNARPLLPRVYAAAVDVVGGATLENVLKQLDQGGAVAACGLVQSAELQLTLFPFILRGVALLGIDSAECGRAQRLRVWERLAGAWAFDPEPLVTEVTLDELDPWIDRILAGEVTGRVLIRVPG